MIGKLYIAILLFLCIPQCAESQIEPQRIFGIDDGLPTTEIYDIEADDLGRMWFTSDRGVSVYDGYNFTTYGIEDGLTDNTNFEIIKDKKGWLWFTAYNGTLSYYDGHSIKAAGINEQLKKIDYENWIEQIIQYSEDTYLLIPHTLIGTKVYREDGNLNIYEYHITNDSLAYVDLSSFIRDKETKLLYSKKYGLGLDEELSTFFPYKGKGVTAYLGRKTTYIDAGLKYITRVVSDNKILYDKENKEKTFEVSFIDNELYLCTRKGITRLDISNRTEANTFLEGHLITKFLKGPQGNYWVSTQASGVYFIPNLAIKNFEINRENFEPVNLTSWKNHLVITARNEAGFFVINNEHTTVFENYNSDRMYYGWNTVADNHLYFCTLGKLSFNELSKSFSFSPNTIISINGAFTVFRKSIYLGNDEWYTPLFTALSKTNSNSNETNNLLGKLSYSIESIYRNSEGTYIGTSEGLKRFKDPKQLEELKDYNPVYGLKINNIIPIDTSKNSGLLMSTLGYGLMYKRHNEDKEPYIINTDRGISSNTINTVKVENDSTLWIGGTKGLDRVVYQLKSDSLLISSISNISKSNGLASDYIIDIEFWNDEVWVTTKSGISYFNYNDLDLRPKPSSIYFDKMRVNHSDVNELDKVLNFSHNENNIEIHYTGVSYNKPTSTPFYKTIFSKKGQDTILNLTDSRDAQFIDLTPGSYTFSVSASDNEGHYSGEPIELRFDIKKHYRQTIWFRILSVLLLLIIAYSIYRSREKTLIRRSQQKEVLQETKLRLKAAELNALRNQMNPHFIYNALNSIQNYIFKGNPEKANYLLSRFGRLMRSSLKLSGLEYITIEEELDFLKNYLELEQMRFGDQFTYDITIAADVLAYKIPPLLLQPLIENGIKHGIENKKDGHIQITITKNDTYIVLVIEDNGIGYNPNKKQEREGPSALKIIRERINIINKDAKVLSSFHLSAINSNSKSGTRATLKLAKTKL